MTLRAIVGYAKHAVVVMKHKWFVLVAGLRAGVPLRRLLVHDFSKFSRSEWGPYARKFCGAGYPVPGEFTAAWAHHLRVNDHHPEYWGGRPMPAVCVLEMVADWMAAARTYDGAWPRRTSYPWLAVNWTRINLHADARSLALRILAERFRVDIVGVLGPAAIAHTEAIPTYAKAYGSEK